MFKKDFTLLGITPQRSAIVVIRHVASLSGWGWFLPPGAISGADGHLTVVVHLLSTSVGRALTPEGLRTSSVQSAGDSCR